MLDVMSKGMTVSVSVNLFLNQAMVPAARTLQKVIIRKTIVSAQALQEIQGNPTFCRSQELELLDVP